MSDVWLKRLSTEVLFDGCSRCRGSPRAMVLHGVSPGLKVTSLSDREQLTMMIGFCFREREKGKRGSFGATGMRFDKMLVTVRNRSNEKVV